MLYRLFLLFTFSLSLFASANLHGQTNVDSVKSIPMFREPGYTTSRDINTTKPEIDIDKWVDETSSDISKVRPGSFSPNPSADRAVVRSVYKSVKIQKAALGLSDESILKSVFSAWIDLAVKTFDKYGKEANYSEEDLLDKAMIMSEVSIQTKPEGATIMIDKYKGYGESNAYVWVGEGKHVLEIIKQGYIPIKETIEIKSTRPMPLVRTLQRAK